jgi:predicted dehydrogenase
MDYTTQPLLFRIKKVLRYVRLYGPSRTYVKVRGQLHMKKRFEQLPPSRPSTSPKRRVGLIGCGNYSFSNIAYYLHRKRGDVIGACMDIDPHRAASMSRTYGIPQHSANADDIFAAPGIDLLYIASNHASHAEYAIRGLELGKHVYIEKPHVVNERQLHRLTAAMRGSSGRVFLGFNRPGSRFGRLILDYLNRETGAGMYSWFVAGHAIEPDHWYFRPEEGGRVLGNLCHWTDFVLRMAPGPRFPVLINPTRGRKSDCDMVVSYTFPDETIASISFSAKGHTFEGVKEQLRAHRGNCLLSMDDYRVLTIEVGARKTRHTNAFRDHGHAHNILGAYDSVVGDLPYDRESTSTHVVDSAWLFLQTKRALEENTPLTISSYAESVTGAVEQR